MRANVCNLCLQSRPPFPHWFVFVESRSGVFVPCTPVHGKPELIHGAPSDSNTKPWLSHMPILQVSCCRTLGPPLPVASHSSAIACCVALEQRIGRAKFFAACMVGEQISRHLGRGPRSFMALRVVKWKHRRCYFGQIRCFGVNATSPRARESGSTCDDLMQAFFLFRRWHKLRCCSLHPCAW